MKINLVMIVRNEERSLERCLKSAEHLVDDIIIADTGSADRTKEIARNAGALVLEYEWNDDFSAARNFALDHSDGDWNLVLDADETLRPYTRKGLEERISRLWAAYGQAWMGAITRYDSYHDGDGISVSTMNSRTQGLSVIPFCWRRTTTGISAVIKGRGTCPT